MGVKYLIEIRLGGAIKHRLRDIIRTIADRFDVYQLVRDHYVPHISLFGTFGTTQEKVVLARLRDVCAQYDVVPFRFEGFDHFDRNTIYADVHSSRALRQLRYELSQELRTVTFDERPYDHDRWCKFHSTVARDIEPQFDEIWNFVTTECEVAYNGYVERVSLIRNDSGDIVKEYSVPQGRFLNSETATAKPGWKRDETLIERYRRPTDHDGLISSQPGILQRLATLAADRWATSAIEPRRNSEFDDRPSRTFIIGDLHLNHGNIIEYCDRPFESIAEMNQRLVANWNDTVGPHDTVVFLGDLAFYDGDISTHDWLHALNGEISFIRGNHDRAESIEYKDDHILETDTREYYCTHRPDDIPEEWDGWAIHGHVHDDEQYPFLDPRDRRINAAPEFMAYTPLAIPIIEKAIASIEDRIVTVTEILNHPVVDAGRGSVAHELKEIDEKILDYLKEGREEGRPWGRNTPTNIAEEVDSSRQWVTTRLQKMESADYVDNIGGGVYEFVEDPREKGP